MIERITGWYVVGFVGLAVVLAADYLIRRRLVLRFRQQLEDV